MRVELYQRDRSDTFVDSAQDGQENGVISSDADGTCALGQDLTQLGGDAGESVFDGKRVNGQITIIGDSPFLEWVRLQDRIPGTNDGRLLAHVAGAEARAGTVGSTGIKRNADQRDIQVRRAGNMRQAHEGRESRKAGIDESVSGLRVRFDCFFRWHQGCAIIKHGRYFATSVRKRRAGFRVACVLVYFLRSATEKSMPRYEYRILNPTPEAEKSFLEWIDQLDREFMNRDPEHRSKVARDALYQLYLGRSYSSPRPSTPLAEQALVHSHAHDLNDGMIVENQKTEIGPRARVTYHATVLSGVKVGEHGMVGSMGVASKNVEPYHIVGGIPAKPIKVKSIAPEVLQRGL